MVRNNRNTLSNDFWAGVVIFLLALFAIAALYKCESVSRYLFGDNWREAMWVGVASVVAILTLCGHFINKYLSERALRALLRMLLAQELLENARRAFLNNPQLEFQTFGFHRLKENLSLIKDHKLFFKLSALYTKIDYCRYHKKDMFEETLGIDFIPKVGCDLLNYTFESSDKAKMLKSRFKDTLESKSIDVSKVSELIEEDTELWPKLFVLLEAHLKLII